MADRTLLTSALVAGALVVAACSGGDDTVQPADANSATSEGGELLEAEATTPTSESSGDSTDAERAPTPVTGSATADTTAPPSATLPNPPTTVPRPSEVGFAVDPETDEGVEVAEVDGGPATFEEVLEFGIEAGLWDELTGLEQVLGYAVGAVPAALVPGADQVVATEIGTLLDLAHAYSLDDGYSDQQLEVLRGFYELAVPSPTDRDRLAESAPNPAIRPLRGAPMSQCAPVDPAAFSGWATIDDGCYLVLKSVVAGVTLRVFYPAWYGEVDELAALPELAEQSMQRSTETYESLGEIGDVDLIFSLTDTVTDEAGSEGSDGTHAVATVNAMWGEATSSGACPVTIFPNGTTNEQHFLQVVAHEVWHCVQHYSGFPQGVAAGTAWYHEGGAHYFSNVVYPNANLERLWLDRFDRRSVSTPLFDMSYEAWVWWQWFGNQSSPRAIADFHLQLVSDGDGGRSEMEGWGEYFQQFVVDYVAGKIREENGELLPQPTAISAAPLTVEKDDEGRVLEYTSQPFVASRWQLKYDKDLRVLQSDQTASHGWEAMVKQQNRGEIEAWKQIFPEVRSECRKQAKYLLVATTDKEVHEAKIQIDRIEEAPCDPCVLGTWDLDLDTFEAMILDVGLQGGQALPPGTSMDITGHYYTSFEDEGVMKTQRDGLTISFSAGDFPIAFTIDSYAEGRFTADGERMTVTDVNERFVNVTTSVPGLGNVGRDFSAGVSEDGDGTYSCDDEEMTVTATGLLPLRYDRVDKVLQPPDTVPSG